MKKQQSTEERGALAITPPEPSVAQMLSGVLQNIKAGNVTAEHVEVAGKMMELYRDHQKELAQKEFAAALVDLQGETIRVQATKAVDMKPDGTCRYKFAPYEEIMAKVQPMLTRAGFSVSFDTQEGEGRLTSTCTLTHRSGHARSNSFAVRYTKPPGASDAQGDMSTKSYAKRGALCDALNIVIDHDDDARMVGKPICKAEAEDLEHRVKQLGISEAAFLKYGGAANYESISEERYDSLITLLDRKEQEAKAIVAEVRNGEPEPKNEQGEYIL